MLDTSTMLAVPDNNTCWDGDCLTLAAAATSGSQMNAVEACLDKEGSAPQPPVRRLPLRTRLATIVGLALTGWSLLFVLADGIRQL